MSGTVFNRREHVLCQASIHVKGREQTTLVFGAPAKSIVKTLGDRRYNKSRVSASQVVWMVMQAAALRLACDLNQTKRPARHVDGLVLKDRLPPVWVLCARGPKRPQRRDAAAAV